MQRELAVAADPQARLRAAGLGYVRFTLAEPGLFRTAFGVVGPPPPSAGEPTA